MKRYLAVALAAGLALGGMSMAQAAAKPSHKAKHSHQVKKNAKTKARALKIVNINKADVATLATLKGLGPKRAAKIVLYREKNGKFKAVKDLAKVKGIGVKFIKRNEGRLKA